MRLYMSVGISNAENHSIPQNFIWSNETFTVSQILVWCIYKMYLSQYILLASLYQTDQQYRMYHQRLNIVFTQLME